MMSPPKGPKVLQPYDLDQILKGTDGYILFHTLEGEILGANKQTANLLGYEVEEISQIFVANIKPKVLRLADVCKSSKESDAPVVFQKRNGKRFAAKVWTKVLQAKVNQAVENIIQLEFKVAQQTKIKNDSEIKVDLQETLAFLNVISEEFDSSAREIQQTVAALRKTKLDHHQQALVMSLVGNGERISNHSKQVVDAFSLGINSFKLDFQPFNLIDLIDDLNDGRNQFFKAVENLSIHLDAAIPELVFGDARRLAQVLDNLINTFCKPGYMREVRLEVTKLSSSDRIRFCFRFGCEKNTLDMASDLNEKYHSEWLIAKQIVQIMNNGELRSYQDSGYIVSEVEIELPEVHRLDLSGDTHFLKDKSILLFELSPSLLIDQLETWGGKVDVIRSIDQLKQYDQNRRGRKEYDLGIIHLPKKNEDFKSLNIEQLFGPLPKTLLLTAKGDRFNWQAHLELESPFRVGLLGNELAKVLHETVPYPYTFNNQRRRVVVSNKKHRILLVDDTVTTRKITAKILEQAGYQVDLAYNGIDALLATGQIVYDLILMDIQMPHMDGIEATTHIRKNVLTNQDTPVIALTSDTSENVQLSCNTVGINQVIQKPVTQKTLLPIIASQLNNELEPVSNKKKEAPAKAKYADSTQDVMSEENTSIKEDVLNQLVKDTSQEACNDMLDIFMREMTDSIKFLDSAFDEIDFSKIAREAHAVRSACRTFGCESLYQLAKEIEDCAKKGDKKMCRDTARQIVPVFNGSKKLLEMYKSKLMNDNAR